MAEEQNTSKPAVPAVGGVLHEEVKSLRWLSGGILIVLFAVVVAALMSLGAVLHDSMVNKQATYQNLVNQINAANTKADIANDKINLILQLFLQSEKTPSQNAEDIKKMISGTKNP